MALLSFDRFSSGTINKCYSPSILSKGRKSSSKPDRVSFCMVIQDLVLVRSKDEEQLRLLCLGPPQLVALSDHPFQRERHKHRLEMDPHDVMRGNQPFAIHTQYR